MLRRASALLFKFSLRGESELSVIHNPPLKDRTYTIDFTNIIIDAGCF